jgi:hypothetical protein
MNDEQQKEYRALCRGAATYILLGQKNPPVDALELARLYQLDPVVVTEDIDTIVQGERRKAGGVFESGN